MEIWPQKYSLEGMYRPKLFFRVVVLMFTNFKQNLSVHTEGNALQVSGVVTQK
jgi:hypothetical protein